MRLIFTSALLLSALWPSTARPCSIALWDEVPTYNNDLLDGPPLLFFAELSDPKLYTGGSTRTVELQVVSRPELGVAIQIRPMIVAQVAGPLAPGTYLAGGQSFDISPQGRSVRTPPVPPAETQLEVRIFEGTCGRSSIGVQFPSDQPKLTLYVLTGRAADGRTEARLLHNPAGLSNQGTVFEVLAFTEARICYQLQGLALDGSLGAPLDLGCIDPTDGDDPRVVYTGDGMFGCSSVAPSIELPTLVVLLGGFALRRRRPSR